MNTYNRDLLEYDQGMKDRIAEGDEIESLYAVKNPGMLVDEDFKDWQAQRDSTVEYEKMKASRVFEATILTDCMKACRVDALEYNGDGSVTQKEIKNTTSIKENGKYKEKYILDASFQRWCLNLAGYVVDRTYIVYLNKDYVRDGELDLDQLFIEEDVTDQCLRQIEKFESDDKTSEILEILADRENPPEVTMSLDCIKAGRNCNFEKHCSSKCGFDKAFTSRLFNASKQWALRKKVVNENKIFKMEDMPEVLAKKLAKFAKLDYNFTMEGKSLYYDKMHLTNFLDSLNWPLYQFDFETFKSAIPRFDKSSPHQQIPFQYSCHKQERNGEVTHSEFLHMERGERVGLSDPREKLIIAMIDSLGESGDILAWNSSFEESRVKELIRDFPQYREKLVAIFKRFKTVDSPFTNRMIYLPSMKSSWSLKYVGPSVLGEEVNDYSDLQVSNGAEAMSIYNDLAKNAHNYSDNDLARIEKGLLVYCKYDTENPTMIVDFMHCIVGRNELISDLTKKSNPELLNRWNELKKDSREYETSEQAIIFSYMQKKIQNEAKKDKLAFLKAGF
jgi:hypothetical protein